MEAKLISVALGAMVGGLISFSTFHYKLHIDAKGKVNEALFHLLEVCSLIGLAKFIQSEEYFNKLINGIKIRFPKENITEIDKAKLKAGMAKSLPILMNTQSPTDGFYTDKYTSAVNDLASVYPVQAFELNKNQMLIKFLKSLDTLVSEEAITDSEQIIINRMMNFCHDDSLKEFEKDLLSLSKKSGFSNNRAVSQYIERTKNKLENIPDSALNDYIDQVIAPIIKEHYDKLGIENTNNIKAT